MIKQTEHDEQLRDSIMTVLRGSVGEGNRVKRDHLLGLLKASVSPKVSDRLMRKVIEDLRGTDEGSKICSTTRGGGGYFLAETRDELDQYLGQEESRIRELAQRIRRQRNAAGFGQHQSLLEF